MTISHEDRRAFDGFRAETHLDAPAGPPSHFIVHALGRDFRVSDEMARIFIRQAERVLETDSSALVVLRHTEGVELLLVTDDDSFSIRAATPATPSPSAET